MGRKSQIGQSINAKGLHLLIAGRHEGSRPFTQHWVGSRHVGGRGLRGGLRGSGATFAGNVGTGGAFALFALRGAMDVDVPVLTPPRIRCRPGATGGLVPSPDAVPKPVPSRGWPKGGGAGRLGSISDENGFPMLSGSLVSVRAGSRGVGRVDGEIGRAHV